MVVVKKRTARLIAPPKGETRATPWGVMLKPIRRQTVSTTVNRNSSESIALAPIKNTKANSNPPYKTSLKKIGSNTAKNIPKIVEDLVEDTALSNKSKFETKSHKVKRNNINIHFIMNKIY